jgi:hypothetical protein
MQNCIATVGAGELARDYDLTGASLLRMVDWDDSATPAAIVSTPRRIGPNELLMSYGDIGP